MNRDKSYWWFVAPFIGFLIMLLIIGASMAHAFNLSPYTFKLRSRTAAADTAFIRGDTLFTTDMSVLASVLLRASNKVVTDTIQGINGYDTTRILGTIWTDTARVKNRLYFTATKWTSYLDSARVDSLIGQLGRFASGGSPGAEIHDSLDANWATFTAGGGTADSNAITYEADRVGMYTDTGLYLGDVGDSTMLQFNLTDDNIISFVKIYYGEDLADSALVTYGTVEAMVNAIGNGDITGVITSDWLTGGASSGDVALGIDPVVMSAINVGADTVRIQNGNSGRIVLNIDGTPPSTDEMTITENNIEIRSAGSNGVLYLSGYDIERAQFGDSGKVLMSNGASTAPSFQTVAGASDSIFNNAYRAVNTTVDSQFVTWYTVDSTITARVAAAGGGDVTGVTAGNGLTGTNESGPNPTLNVGGGWSIGVATDSIYVKQVSGDSVTAGTVADARIATTIARDSEIKDSIHTARTMGSIWTLSADWVNTANPWADNEVANDITINYADSTGKTTHGSINLWDLASNSVDSTKIVDNGIGYADLGVGAVNKIKGTVVDSATGALRASLLIAPQGSANTAGRLTADSIVVDTLFATRGNFTNLKVGSDAFITDITGDGLAISGSALTASLGTAITSSEITDDEVSWSDLDSTTTRTYIFDIVKDSLWTNTPNFFRTAGNGLTSTGSTVDIVGSYALTVAANSLYVAAQKISPSHIDSSQTIVVGGLRTRPATTAIIRSNNIASTDADSVLKIGSGVGLTISSYVALGTDITDDTVLVTLPAEWAGAVLSRGYGTDSTKGWDSLTISGGSDIYGNYIQFAKTATTSGTPTAMRRNFQIAIPIPDDADTVYDVSIAYRVQDGTGAESSYVRLKWSTTPFDSSSANTYKLAYTDRDSSNSTTFDTLGVDYNRTYVTRGSKIYVLVTALLYDFHTTWARCYDLMMTYRRNRL